VFLPPEQFIIRSAPCVFFQTSSLYVLRPVPSPRAVRYKFCSLCLPPEQFVIRSAPCAFPQNSSLYVLRPVPSSRAVRYTFCALCLPPEQFIIRSAPCAFLQSRPLYAPCSFYCITSLSLSPHFLLSIVPPLHKTLSSITVQ